MSKNLVRIFTLLSLVLSACKGSDDYLGDWKGTDINGDQYTLSFSPKSFWIKRTDGDSLNFEYTQNSVKIENSVRTYGLKLKDGRGYNIHFPIANDRSKGFMTMENGKPVYTLSRTAYISQEDVYKLVK